MDSKSTKQGGTNIQGNHNVVGDNNIYTNTQISAASTENAIRQAVKAFVDEVQLSDSVTDQDKQSAIDRARELQETLNSPRPNLGVIQKFRDFLREKGGSIAVAGLKLLANASVKVAIEETVKNLIE